MKLVVGLGNPGNKYEKTRHNIGFDVIENLSKELKANGFKEKFQGLLTEANCNGEKVLILKPLTFMNLSGDSIQAVAKFYKIDTSEIIIVYDDMDTPLGKLRFRDKGSSGGHNGIKSIISHFGENFARVRCGIGKPTLPSQVGGPTIDFVLGKFTKEEQPFVDEMTKMANNCICDFLKDVSYDKIMQKYNKK